MPQNVPGAILVEFAAKRFGLAKRYARKSDRDEGPVQSFSELSLSAPILRAIADLGYETPSPIQAETVPVLLGEPTDFLGLAATGTGKTAAFGIPMLERLETGIRDVQALILCPTRELAMQVSGQIDLLGKHKGLRSVAIYGGSSYGEQIRALRSGVAVVVGTPGRVADHLDRGTLQLDQLKIVILDEADEMISMGFKDELEKILASVPRESSNTWLFSATMSREVRHVADKFLRSPKEVRVNRKEMLPSTVEQYYYATQESDKPEVLCKLIEAADSFYGLIFCQTKSMVADLTQYLHERGYKVDCLHGDKDQSSREKTLKSFRDRTISILVGTDVASRGIDVKDITHVINYSLPRELDNYVHRVGRTARSGKTGIAMNLVTPSHRRLVVQIENMTKTRMIEGRIPTRREIGAKRVARQLESFMAQTYHARAVEVMSDDWKAALVGMSAEEVAGRFVTMMMPDVFNDREQRSNHSGARTFASSSRSVEDRAPRAREASVKQPVTSVIERRGVSPATRPYAPSAPSRATAPVWPTVSQTSSPANSAMPLASLPVALPAVAAPKKAKAISAPVSFAAKEDARPKPIEKSIERANDSFAVEPRAKSLSVTRRAPRPSVPLAERVEGIKKARKPSIMSTRHAPSRMDQPPRRTGAGMPRFGQERHAADMTTMNRRARRALKFGQAESSAQASQAES